MKTALVGVVSLLLLVALSVPGFCAAQDGEKKGIEEKFKALDADGDGKVSLEEYTTGKEGEKKEAAEKKFGKLDADGDGALTLDEFKAGAKSGKKKKEKEKE